MNLIKIGKTGTKGKWKFISGFSAKTGIGFLIRDILFIATATKIKKLLTPNWNLTLR